MPLRAIALACVVLASGALSGCVAALPLAAGTVLTRQAVKGDDAKAEGARVPGERPATTSATARASVPPASASVPTLAMPAPAVNRTEDFMAAALFAVDAIGSETSVIPDPAAEGDAPLVRPCHGARPALIVDLDPGDIAFQPQPGTPRAQPGLAGALAAARAGGLAVLWSGILDESRAGEVRAALVASGLDPAGADVLLLTRDPAESKTDRRNAELANWCVKAIVGDRKGDFDALFDYLRESDAPTPFDSLIGAGWFLLPPPLDYPA